MGKIRLNNKRIYFFLIIISFLLLTVASISAAELKVEEIEFQNFKLENGLEVMVFPDHSIPSLRLSIYYKVGAIDELEGQTGISHFLEHLMFLGTEALPEGNIDDLISSVGGQLNAATSYDYTYYYHEVPSSMLELVMALEADRMGNLQLDPAEIEREREVIKQERRLRTENNIFSRAFEEIKAEAFNDSYLEHEVIGWMEDIDNISLQELKNHYNNYYAPNNALLVVSGDVEFSEVKVLAEKYFADYQAEEINRPELKLDKQQSEKVHEVYLQTNIPYSLQLYKIPAGSHQDIAALNIFLDILANNQSSRLKENLQKKDNLILDSGAFLNPMREDSYTLVYLIPADISLIEKSQNAFDQELNKLFESGITEEEFQMVKNQYQKSLIFSQKDINNAAASAALNKLRFNNPNLERERIEFINQLSREELIATAEKYFQKENRTRGYILPEKEGENQ